MDRDEPRQFIPQHDATQPPPAGEVYGIFFPSAALDQQKVNDVHDKFCQIAGDRTDLHILIWPRSDPNYGRVQRRFGVADPPAVVLTKPFRGSDVLQQWDWSDRKEMFDRLVQPGGFPVHAVIQGDAAFRDTTALADNLEKLAILFAAPAEEIEQALRQQRINELLQRVGRGVGHGAGLLKGITVTFSVLGFNLKLGFDQSGATVSADQVTPQT
jgi:hypothetical protein